MIDPDFSASEVILTLVHGTFATNADWPKPGSQLRRIIEERLSGRSIGIERFVWSGGNSHQARIRAGLELRRFLRNQSRKHPQAKQVVIAHSHGGNVAMYGIRRVWPRLNLSAVICLGTPFVHCARAELLTTCRVWRRSVLLLAALLLAALGYRFPSASMPLCVVGILLIPVSFYVFDPTGFLGRRWKTRQDQLCRHLKTPTSFDQSVLCVATGLDEAKVILDVADATAKVGGGMIGLLAKLGTVFFAFVAVIALGVMIWGVSTLWEFSTLVKSQNADNQGKSGELLGTLLVVIAAGFTFVVSITALLLLRLTALPIIATLRSTVKTAAYGRISSGGHMLLQVTQERFPPPPIAFELQLFNLRKPFFAWNSSLRHSMLYTNQDVLDFVGTWLSQRLAPANSDDGSISSH